MIHMSQQLTIPDCVFNQDGPIIDTHAHYNLEPLYADWPGLWAKAQSLGIAKTVVPGTSLESSRRGVEIASHEENLFALVGVHPSEASASADLSSVISELSKLLENDHVLGVGEVGLDYFRLKPEERESQSQLQQVWFKAQLDLARQHGGWLALHVRDQQTPSIPTKGNAYWDAYEIVKKYDWSSQPFILHCVSGSPEYVKAMLELGAYVGFDGNLTYPKADSLRELLQLVPRDRLLIETDAPYLPPQPYRGQTCEPWMIVETAKWLNNYLSDTKWYIEIY